MSQTSSCTSTGSTPIPLYDTSNNKQLEAYNTSPPPLMLGVTTMPIKNLQYDELRNRTLTVQKLNLII